MHQMAREIRLLWLQRRVCVILSAVLALALGEVVAVVLVMINCYEEALGEIIN